MPIGNITTGDAKEIAIRLRIKIAIDGLERVAKEFNAQAVRVPGQHQYLRGRADQAKSDMEALEEILRA